MCCSWFSGDLWSLLSFTLIGYWCRQRQVLCCQLSSPGRNWWWVLWSNIQAGKWRHLCWVILCGSYFVTGWLMEPFFGEIDSVFREKILQGLYSSLTIAASLRKSLSVTNTGESAAVGTLGMSSCHLLTWTLLCCCDTVLWRVCNNGFLV